VQTGLSVRYMQSGALICPECYDEMRAAYVKDPKKFKEWERETLAQP